jgi:hypothetical protein
VRRTWLSKVEGASGEAENLPSVRPFFQPARALFFLFNPPPPPGGGGGSDVPGVVLRV